MAREQEPDGFFLEAPQGYSVRLDRATASKANVRGLYTGDFSSCTLIAVVKGDRISLLHADVTTRLEDFLREIEWVEFAEDPNPVAARCEVTIFYKTNFLLDLERRLSEVNFVDCNMPEIQLVTLLALRGPDTIFSTAYFERANARPNQEQYSSVARCLKDCAEELQATCLLKLIGCGSSSEEAAETVIESVGVEFVDAASSTTTTTTKDPRLDVVLRQLSTESWSSEPAYVSTGVLPALDRGTAVTGHAGHDRTRVTVSKRAIVSHPQVGVISSQRALADTFCPDGAALQLAHERAPTCVNANLGGWFPFTAAHHPLPPVDGTTCELKLEGLPALDLKPFLERCRKEPDFLALQRTTLEFLTTRYQALGKLSNLVAINGDMEAFLLRESAHLLSSLRLWVWPKATPAWFWAVDCRKLAQVVHIPLPIETPERTHERDCSLNRYQSAIHSTLLQAARVVQDVESTAADLDAIQEIYEHAAQASWSSVGCIQLLTDRLLARCKAGADAARKPGGTATAARIYQEAQALCGISQLSNSPRFVKIARNLEKLPQAV